MMVPSLINLNKIMVVGYEKVLYVTFIHIITKKQYHIKYHIYSLIYYVFSLNKL